MNSIQTWYENNYYRMSGGGLWFSGKGLNILPSNEWSKRKYRILIVRLSTFKDTEVSFTHQLLYQIAAGCDDVFVDCAWLPPFEDSLLFDESHIPWMTGVVSKRAASEFDCIAFSHSIMQEVVNIPVMLEKSSIPARKTERMKDNNLPLILLGGANALFDGCLLNPDPPVDALFTGENTGVIRDLLLTCAAAKRDKIDKQTLISKLAEVESMVLPDQPAETCKKQYSLVSQDVLMSAPVFFGRTSLIPAASLMISEGCPCFCSFCAESWSRKPYREMPLERCMDAALTMKMAMGLEKIDLYSFNFNMHEDFKRLLLELSGIYPAIGLKSQRLDGIAKDSEMMKLLHAAGKSSLTVGIEGISARLRQRLQKSLDEETIRSGLTRILSSPLRELKLFFIATGDEEEVDFEEFRNLMRFISETLRNVGRQPRIIISMTPLVRFPFTPLQNDVAPEPEKVQKIIQQCERLTMAKRFEFRTASDSLDYLFSQVLLRPISANVWNALAAAVKLAGFVYYREFTPAFINLFLRMLDEKGISREDALEGKAYLKMPVKLPVSDTFITKVSEASEQHTDVGYCLGDELDTKPCLGCASCENEDQQNNMTAQRKRQHVSIDLVRKRLAPNREFTTIQLKVSLSEALCGVARNEVASLISRHLMKYHLQLAKGYCGYSHSYIFDRTGSNWVSGDDLLYLKFAPEVNPLLTTMFTDEKWLVRVNAELAGLCRIASIAAYNDVKRKLAFTISTGWETNPVIYLSNQALKYTFERKQDGSENYALSKDTLKKKVIRSLTRAVIDSRWIHHIDAEEKFNLSLFMDSALLLTADHYRYKVKIAASLDE